MDRESAAPLHGVRVVSLAVNVPGPVAAARLADLGADVVKVEPPAGDALQVAAAGWYRELTARHEVVTLDLREAVVTSPVVDVTFYGGMSSLKIIVPPGVEVEWGGGMALLSDEKADPPGEVDPTMWRLRVTHYGLMSDVRVRTLAVGETPTKKWWKGLR